MNGRQEGSDMADKKDRHIRATIEFDILIPPHEKDDKAFVERCFAGTRCKIIEIKKLQETKPS